MNIFLRYDVYFATCGNIKKVLVLIEKLNLISFFLSLSIFILILHLQFYKDAIENKI
jgi:hypothetical protein